MRDRVGGGREEADHVKEKAATTFGPPRFLREPGSLDGYSSAVAPDEFPRAVAPIDVCFGAQLHARLGVHFASSVVHDAMFIAIGDVEEDGSMRPA